MTTVVFTNFICFSHCIIWDYNDIYIILYNMQFCFSSVYFLNTGSFSKFLS